VLSFVWTRELLLKAFVVKTPEKEKIRHAGQKNLITRRHRDMDFDNMVKYLLTLSASSS
jgi:hypothetical protein